MSKDSDATSTSQVTLPPYLEPLVRNATDVSGRALTLLEPGLKGELEPLTAARNSDQQMSAEMLRNFSKGETEGVGQYRNLLNQAIAGQQIQELSPYSFGVMSELSGGNPALSQLSGGAQQASQALSDSINAFNIDPRTLQTASDQLTQTASGDYLTSNPAFMDSLRADFNQIAPQISSTFSRAGGGALSGGLAETAKTQALSDSFARLYNQERGRQVGAANQLANFGLGINQQRIGAGSQLGGLAAQAANANNQLRLGASSNLADLIDRERVRQLNAGGQASQLDLLQAQVRGGVGQDIQNFEQEDKDRRVQSLMNLYNTGLSLLPIGALSGQTLSQPIQRNAGAGALGGALTGAKLGGKLGNPLLGAIGGGILGGFF